MGIMVSSVGRVGEQGVHNEIGSMVSRVDRMGGARGRMGGACGGGGCFIF